jgi:Ca2+:H+ antiporter
VAGKQLMAGLSNPLWLTVIFGWLFIAALGSALAVVRHAEHLAERLGEPYGTLILTLSVTGIEVASISAVTLHGADNPTLLRDTLFALIMIILNGMAGISLLLGGWKYREQQYNLQGANAYLGVIIPLAVLSLALPNFTVTTAGPTLSTVQQTFLILISGGLYAAFLTIQVGRHRGYFDNGETAHHAHGEKPPLLRHVLLLGAYVVPVVFLAKQLAVPIDYLIETLHAPTALGGIVIAALVATPEAIGAGRAALANQMQRSVNIFLGSVLCTIGLTVPCMLAISHFTGQTVVLGLESANNLMLLLTLAVSVLTFASGRTNVLQGVVHIVLFAAYLLLIFQN